MARQWSQQGAAVITCERKQWGPVGGVWQWTDIGPTKTGNLYTVASWIKDNILKNRADKAGHRVNSPYSASGDEQGGISLFSGQYKTAVNGTYYWYDASGACFPYTSPIPDQKLISPSKIAQTKIQLFKDIADQKWNAAVALIESRDAVSLIGSTAKKLERALFFAQQRNWPRVASTLGVKPKSMGAAGKSSSRGWLEYQFGWAPLVEDMAQAMVFLSRTDDRPIIIEKTRRTSATGSFNSTSTDTHPGLDYAVYLEATSEFETKLEDFFVCGASYSVSAPQLRELEKYGFLGLSTAWAVTPWSWMVDWVLPIGDILKALDAPIGLTYLDSYETYFRKSTTKAKRTIAFQGGSPWAESGNPQVETFPASSWKVDRSVPMSMPSVQDLYVKDPFSVWKTITSLALLGQRAAEKPRT